MMDADGQHQPEDIARLLEYKDTFVTMGYLRSGRNIKYVPIFSSSQRLPVSYRPGLLSLYIHDPGRRFTNMSALLFNSSLLVFMIGLVAEQISHMRYDRIK